MKVFLVLAGFAAVAILACSDRGSDGKGTPDGSTAVSAPSPAASLEPSYPPTATPLPTRDPEDELRPAPGIGAACLVEAALCEAAFELLALAHSGDWQSLLASAEPRTLTCPAPSKPLPIIVFSPGDVCEGAAEGEVRPYFTATGQSGEGQSQSPARFAKSLEEYFTQLTSGSGLERDAYGAGNLVLAAIGCFRTTGPSGTCTGEWARVILTGISQGERGVHCFGFDRRGSQNWVFHGLGCGFPRTHLYHFSVAAAVSEQVRGTYENYPWTPLARHPLPPAALAALRANLPVPAPLDGECQVAPQSAEVALCYTNIVETASGLEVNFLYRGTSGGWKATLTRLADGTYRVDAVEPQYI